MKIVHISDLHYDHTGNNTRKITEKIINHYKDFDTKPVIINSGDFIEKGTRKELAGCKLHIQKLVDNGFDLLICPGNHDVRRIKGAVKNKKGLYRFDQYYRSLLPKGKNYLGDEDNNLIDFPVAHNYDNYFFIGLDSNRSNKKITPRGKLGKNQLQELAELISEIKKENQGAIVTVYLHHNPFKYSINIRNIIGFEQMKLVDRKSFLEIVRDKVDVLLFGHSHWDERYVEEESTYGLRIAQLSAEGTHSSKLIFNEIDLVDFKVTQI